MDITLYSTENGWSENTITWDNAPRDGSVIDRVRLGPDDTYYEWDVSSYLVGESEENVSFVLYDEGRENRLVSFSSSEGPNPPELKVLYARGNARVSNLVLNVASIVDQPQELAVVQSATGVQQAGADVSSLTASGGGGGVFGLQFLFLLFVAAIGGVRQRACLAHTCRVLKHAWLVRSVVQCLSLIHI